MQDKDNDNNSIGRRTCPKCGIDVAWEYRYCPFCAMALTPQESVIAMDIFIRERIEQQIKGLMKDDRLVASEVAGKVFRIIRYTFLPLLVVIAVLGWFGYSNLREAVKPISDEAKRQANEAVAIAKQAKKTSSEAADEATVAGRLAKQNAAQVGAFAADSEMRQGLARKQLAGVESSVALTTQSLSGKFMSLEKTAASFDVQLKAKAEQLQSYERRVSNLSTQVARVSAERQFPGLGQPSVATVRGEILNVKEKKADEKYLVFDLTQSAVIAGTMKEENVVRFEDDIQAKGFKVFGGTPSFGRANGSHFEVTPFKRETNCGVLVVYFRPEHKRDAEQVYSILGRYVNVGTCEPQLVSEKDYYPTSRTADFVELSGIDVYVQVAPRP